LDRRSASGREPSKAALRGTYRIVRLLPPDANANQYRIKSTVDGHERVVRESQLSRD
jgi:hypothetical protein